MAGDHPHDRYPREWYQGTSTDARANRATIDHARTFADEIEQLIRAGHLSERRAVEIIRRSYAARKPTLRGALGVAVEAGWLSKTKAAALWWAYTDDEPPYVDAPDWHRGRRLHQVCLGLVELHRPWWAEDES